MLVITRSSDQAVLIYKDGNLVGTVKVCKGDGRIRLGFDFPREYKILREEIELHREDER